MKTITLFLLFVVTFSYAQQQDFLDTVDLDQLTTTETKTSIVVINRVDNNSMLEIETFTSRVDFDAAYDCPSLVEEDFAGMPIGINVCGMIISSSSEDDCFEDGEIQEGFSLYTNEAELIAISAGEIGNTINFVGANTGNDYTIVSFTEDIYAVAHVLWENASDGELPYRIYGTGGDLIGEYILNLGTQTETFFGFISDEPVSRIELGTNDPPPNDAELLGDFAFGNCPVGGFLPPVNLLTDYSCTDIALTWDITEGTPDSYNIYRNGDLLTNVTSLSYTDMLVDPLVDYCYTVTAIYGEGESAPTNESCLTVPWPENLGIQYIDGWQVDDTAFIVWDEPEACVDVDEFNVYKNGTLIGSTVDTFYVDPGLLPELYEYYVTGVYYFGESENSESIYILIVSLDENKPDDLIVSPNPALDFIQVTSDIHIQSYSIMNNFGQVLESGRVESSNFSLNVSQYSSGMYYLRFETDNKPILRKIILK